MAEITLQSRSDSEKKICVEFPVDLPNTEFILQVSYQPHQSESSEWPIGYFDLLGSIQDETLTVQPQPPLPTPTEI